MIVVVEVGVKSGKKVSGKGSGWWRAFVKNGHQQYILLNNEALQKFPPISLVSDHSAECFPGGSDYEEST